MDRHFLPGAYYGSRALGLGACGHGYRQRDNDRVGSAKHAENATKETLSPQSAKRPTLMRAGLARRAASAGTHPLFYVGHKLVVASRNWGAALAGIPAPLHQRRLHMFDKLRQLGAVAVLFRIFEQLTQLPIRESLPNHRHVCRRQVPIVRARRHI